MGANESILEITSRHDSVNEPVKQHVRERLDGVFRHVDDVISVHVVLDVEKLRHLAEIVLHARNLTAAVHAETGDMYASIDRCVDKLKHQLEHQLGRRRTKRRRSGPLAEAELAAMAQAAEALDGDEAEATTGPNRVQKQSPLLLALTIDEAQANLSGDDSRLFLVFREAESNQVQVLYKRDAGGFGLIQTGAA